MIAINHPILKEQFEQFSKLETEAEKKAFWEAFEKHFDEKNEAEQNAIRRAWDANVSNIETRLKEIDVKLDKQVSEISVFPANAEEASLLTALLNRMGVRFEVG